MRGELLVKAFARKVLADVPSGQEFILHHGGHRKVHNLLELRNEIESMDKDEFHKHVTDKKNDFAAWIKGSIKDSKLSKDLAVISSKDETLAVLSDRINYAVAVMEKENEKIISEELATLKKLETKKPKIHDEIALLEDDLKKLSKNIDYEKRVLENEDDLIMKKWHEYHPVPANARLLEFLFGLVVGLVLGLILARAMVG